MYYREISVIEARQQLYSFESASFSQMKKEDRRSVEKRYNRALESPDKVPDPREVEVTWAFLRARRQKQKAKENAGSR